MSRDITEIRGQLRSLKWQRDDLYVQIDALEEEIYQAEHECPNCGDEAKVAGEPCSRRCRLHLEWAAELKAREAALTGRRLVGGEAMAS